MSKTRQGQPEEAGGPLGDVLGVLLAGAALAAAVVKAVAGRVASRRRAMIDLRDPAEAAGPSASDFVRVRTPVSTKPSRFKAVLHRLGRRWSPLGRALEVQERYSDVHGNNLAAAVTFQAFLSLFPLLIVAVAAVGFLAGSGQDVAGRVVSELGLTGAAATAVVEAVDAAARSRRAASVVGLATLLWAGLGLVSALQFAMNQVWQVEARGLKDKAIAVGWLAGAALLFVSAAAITTVLRWLPGQLAPLGIVVALAVNGVLWMWTSKVLPNVTLPWRAVLPGAVLGAAGLEVLKLLGAYYVPQAVSSSSQLYGTLGVVFAVLAWLFFFGRLIVYSTVLNVIFWERHEGTVRVVTEVPKVPGAMRGEAVSRSGRLEHTS